MRARYSVAAAVTITVVAAIALASYVEPGALSTPALRTSVLLLRIFVVLLITRYILLLWLGYLHHMENANVDDSEQPTHPPVTVIVPVFNEEQVVLPALHSLLALDYPEYHILVVDDGSTDRTRELAESLQGTYGPVTLRVVSRSNGGKAAALNTGIALATTPYVLCMDGDSRLAPQTLRCGMRHFADRRVGAVAGNVKVVNRNNVWTRLQALEYIEGLNLARRAQGFLRIVNIIPGPVGIFRRDVLWSVGGYDNDTFAEDADLTLKILSAGWHVAYEEGAVAWTEAPEFYLDLVRQRYRWTRGILQALRKRTSLLASPRGRVAVWLSLASMLFEAVLWPVISIFGGLLFAVAALSAGVASGIFYWVVLLTLLDVAAALYTVVMEEEDLSLVPYAVIYRFMFVIMIDVAKVFAMVEESANVQMTWGKLARAGRI